jgi:hypothetical protein
MSRLQKKGVPRHAGDPCPDPGVHQHGSIYSSSSSMASRDNIFGPDGKLSSASKSHPNLCDMRYALRCRIKLIKPRRCCCFPQIRKTSGSPKLPISRPSRRETGILLQQTYSSVLLCWQSCFARCRQRWQTRSMGVQSQPTGTVCCHSCCWQGHSQP